MPSTNDTMNFGVDLLPITTETYNLGSSEKKWNIYGSLTGNASTATTATNLNAAPTLVQTGTSTIDLSPNTTYTLTVGGKSVIFKTPNDTKVTQSNKVYSNYTYWRPLVIGSRNASTAGGLSNTATDTTDLVYTFSNIIAQPSTGTIKATIFDGKASTAVKWHSAQTVYVNLASASTSTTLQGGNSNAEVLGVNGTLDETNGGTGQNTYIKGDILYASAANTLSKLGIGTAGYFLKATADGPVWANTTDITTLGTITTGTWNGSKISASYLSASNKNRLVWTDGTDGTFAADNHYASSTQISIGTTSAPDSGYKLRVEGNLETTGLINVITNARTKDLYFSNGTPGNCGAVGRIMYDIGTGPNITKSQMCLVENSYSSTASATPLTYSENYYLPECTAGLTASIAYNILTTKNTVTAAQGGTGLSSYTKGDIIYASGTTTLSKLAIGTNGQFLTASGISTPQWTTIDKSTVGLGNVENTKLSTWTGTGNIAIVGTITTGTWNGSTLDVAYGGTGQTTVGNAYMSLLGRGGLPSGVTSLDDLKTCGCYWINSTECPNGWPASVSSGNYACVEVIGTGMPGVIVQRINLYNSTTFFSRMWANSQWYDWTYNITTKGNNLARTIYSDLYVGADTRASSVKLTRADKAVGFEVYEDFGRALTSTDYSVSQNLCGFLVHSYSTNMSSGGGGITDCNLSSYSENYYFPPANPDLTASVAYYILTTKQYPSAISGRAVPSGATFDTMLTAGVYNIANNCSGYPTTSGTNYNYGILLVATTASPNGSQSNMFQLYLGGSTNASYYKLWIRSRYNKNWKDWKQVTLT